MRRERSDRAEERCEKTLGDLGKKKKTWTDKKKIKGISFFANNDKVIMVMVERED